MEKCEGVGGGWRHAMGDSCAQTLDVSVSCAPAGTTAILFSCIFVVSVDDLARISALWL